MILPRLTVERHHRGLYHPVSSYRIPASRTARWFHRLLFQPLTRPTVRSFCVRALIWLVRVFTSLFVNVPVKSFTYLGDSGTGICVANTDEQKKAIRKIKFRIELPRLMSISILAKIYCWGFTYCGDIIRQIIFLWCVIHDLCG